MRGTSREDEARYFVCALGLTHNILVGGLFL